MTIPSHTLLLIDTHAHLDDDQFAGDIDAVLARARDAGVGRIVNIGHHPPRWETTITLATRFPTVSFTLGMHPHHADEWSSATRATLLDLLDSTGAVAIGEIGLDLFRDGPSLSRQRAVFEEQLLIASDRGLPVVIHQRAAEGAVIETLGQAPPAIRCILHSFEGSRDLAAFAVERGFFIGVGGLMTRLGSADLRAVIAELPLNRLLLETDAPYLAPAGVRNRRNEPANISLVAARLAELLGRSVQELASATTKSACSVFGITANISGTG